MTFLGFGDAEICAYYRLYINECDIRLGIWKRFASSNVLTPLSIDCSLDMEARPWDFQSAEYSLRVCVAQFNNRHYAPSPPVEEKVVNLDFSNTDVMVDYNVLNVLAQDVPLSEEFKENYEEWLEREVFDAKINWDELCGTVE